MYKIINKIDNYMKRGDKNTKLIKICKSLDTYKDQLWRV